MTQTDEKRYDENNEYEVSLLDLLVILVQQRKFIIKTTAVFAVAAVIYALAATPIYKSTLQIMPPGGGQQSGAAAMLAAAGMGDLMMGALSTPADTVAGVIKSPAVLDRVIEKNKLRARKAEPSFISRLLRFGADDKEDEPKRLSDVRKSLNDSVQAAADKKSNIITVSVNDISPEMAVKLAQSLFDETSAIMQTVALTPSAQKRAFLETQIKTNNKELAAAEQKMVSFQKKTGMIAGGGAPSDVSALAGLQASMLSKEIELRASRRFGTSSNPQVKKLQAEYDAIKRQFEADSAKVGTVPLSGVGLKRLPDASMEYAVIYRDYKFREQLNLLLQRQFEAAKLSELDSPVLIQKLGEPTYPERRSSPQRSKIVILATLLGGFLGIFMAFIRHFLQVSGNDPETAVKIAQIKEAIASDLRFGRVGKKK